MSMHVSECVCASECVNVYVSTNSWLHFYIYVCAYMCLCASAWVHTYVYNKVCMLVHTYVNVCVHVSHGSGSLGKMILVSQGLHMY